jgi:Bifunctional DNA primase/polymerase, N-terminal
MTDTEPALPHALAWARRGHGCFPLWWPVKHTCACGEPCGKQAAKHPVASHDLSNRSVFVAPHGCRSATTNTGILKLWFGVYVPEANLGVATERLVVIDTDPRHGGDESLKKLEAEHGELPLTWRSLTGGGGTHDIYKAPDGVEIASFSAENEIKWGREPPLGPGIDVRARGGYICAPPSRHVSGRSYAWSVDHHPAETPLATAPDFLIERLTARGTNNGKGHDPVEWAARRAQTVSEYRDMAIASVAGKLLRAISLDPAFVEALVHAWNACHCDPPLPEQQVQKIFDRICKKEADRAAS